MAQSGDGARHLALPGGRIREGRLFEEFQRALATGSIMADDDNSAPLIIKIQLPPDATPLDFLTAVYRHEGVPLGMRLDAAKNAAMYLHPKLVAIAAVSPGGEKFEIKGGLPALPGATTRMPGTGPVIDGQVVKPKKPEKAKPKAPADEPVEP